MLSSKSIHDGCELSCVKSSGGHSIMLRLDIRGSQCIKVLACLEKLVRKMGFGQFSQEGWRSSPGMTALVMLGVTAAPRGSSRLSLELCKMLPGKLDPTHWGEWAWASLASPQALSEAPWPPPVSTGIQLVSRDWHCTQPRCTTCQNCLPVEGRGTSHCVFTSHCSNPPVDRCLGGFYLLATVIKVGVIMG